MNILHYNSNLKPFAKKLRSNMTLAEVLLWKKLNRKQLGVRFNRQKPISKWVVDFYCKELQLAIEVDGNSHNFKKEENSHNFKKEEDDDRQRKLEALGIRFLRFWDCEVKEEMGSVIERIENWIRENPPRPTGTPPQEGISPSAVPCSTFDIRNSLHPSPPPSPAPDSPPRRGAEGGVGSPARYEEETFQPLEEPTPAFGHPSQGGEPAALDKLPPQNTAQGIPSSGGVPVGRGGSAPTLQQSNIPAIHSQKRGSALIVVMWVLMIVSLIVSTFAFEMQLESRLISAQRKRFKADQLALAGVELAKAMLAFEEDPLEGDDITYDDPFLSEASKIADGVPVLFTEEFGDGTITLRIDYEKGRQKISAMSTEEWHELFDQAGIPNVEWDSLLGCLIDWEDPGDTHQLNGAEKDDPFYRERGYEPKNAPVNTVDELLLIKGWTQEILYGNQDDEDAETPMSGIAQYLTTWGNGKINPNSASREVLNSLNIPEGGFCIARTQ